MARAKIILITGATAGIGRHAALHLARAGHHVIATGRKMEALEALRREAGDAKMDLVALDVAKSESVAAAAIAVDDLTNGYGVDVLVNNAGYGMGAPLEETTDDELHAQYETNVFGLMRVTRAFAPKMRLRGVGRIINVGSVGGRVTFPFMAAYSSTKYAVESLSDGLRRELGPFGVDVCIVEPGPINTEFADRAMASVASHRDPSSPYALVYAESEKMRAQTDAHAAGPEVVTRAIEHAATAKRPRVRYVVPFKMNVVLLFAALLPTRFFDWIIQRSLGMTRERLLAASRVNREAKVAGAVTS